MKFFIEVATGAVVAFVGVTVICMSVVLIIRFMEMFATFIGLF
jgi:hypothetical protein